MNELNRIQTIIDRLEKLKHEPDDAFTELCERVVDFAADFDYEIQNNRHIYDSCAPHELSLSMIDAEASLRTALFLKSVYLNAFSDIFEQSEGTGNRSPFPVEELANLWAQFVPDVPNREVHISMFNQFLVWLQRQPSAGIDPIAPIDVA